MMWWKFRLYCDEMKSVRWSYSYEMWMSLGLHHHMSSSHIKCHQMLKLLHDTSKCECEPVIWWRFSVFKCEYLVVTFCCHGQISFSLKLEHFRPIHFLLYFNWVFIETFVYKISHLCLLTFLMPLKESKQCENSFSAKLNKDFFNVSLRYLSKVNNWLRENFRAKSASVV